MVVISHCVPYDDVPHAGGRYLAHLARVADRHVQWTLLGQDSPANRTAMVRRGRPSVARLVGGHGRSWPARLLNRIALRLDVALRRRDPGMPYVPLALGLLRDREARRAIRDADVLDLQWMDSILLLPLLRRLNPRARTVGTFHDVQSQSFAREPGATASDRAFWQRQAGRMRRRERRAVAALDRVLVFSTKDADLLGSPPNARVVSPPLASAVEGPRTVAVGSATVIFVSYLARAENDDAARWLVGEIWPLVLREVPHARLRLVGAGASEALTGLVAGQPSVTITGFVADLTDEYALAGASIVPLRQGAGVKFKVIESLLQGLPTVTTPVGAEGIGGAELFAGLGRTPRPWPLLWSSPCRPPTKPPSPRCSPGPTPITDSPRSRTPSSPPGAVSPPRAASRPDARSLWG